MKPLRITLIVLMVLYAVGPLFGACLSFFNPAKLAALHETGPFSPGIEKEILLSAPMMLGLVWLYISALALLSRNMKEGYMYAVTLGFIELIHGIAIVAGLSSHGFGSPTDFFAIVKGLLLLVIALIAFKKQQPPAASPANA